MSQGKNILFIGLHHRINDPRLCYREIHTIKDELPDSQIFFLDRKKDAAYGKITIGREKFEINNNIIHRISVIFPFNKNKIINYFFDKFFLQPLFLYYSINECKKLNIDLIQASDAKELLLAVLLSKFCNTEKIYDSHEDYYRQIIDYWQKNLIKYYFALKILLLEFLLIRYFSAVFCTDEFLLEKYQNKVFGAKNIFLLRNFPVLASKDKKIVTYKKNTLKLVYVGGVNKFRGVIECAHYVDIFNNEFSDKNLIFDVYSEESPIINDLSAKGFINHIPWIDYSELMDKLTEYDIGICLWLPIKKFFRNLPLKNFDYMSVGLPIITSNFGNLQKYIIESNAGISINPLSYEEFREAVLKMFDPTIRRKYGQNGWNWVQNHGSFRNEAGNYINFLKKLS